METKLFSPLLSSANNIVKMKRSLPKRARDYNDFINWLDTSNKDIKKIKLPKKKKVEDLKFSVGSALGGGGGGGGGGNGGGILGSLLAALGIRKGANFLKGKLGLPKGKFKGSYEDIIKKLNKKSNLTKGENFALRDYKRLVGKGGLTNNDAAFRALDRNRFNDKFYSDMNGKTLTRSGTRTTGGGLSSETAAQYRQAGRSGGGGFRGAPRGGLGGIAAMKGGGKLALKGGELAAKIIPGLATAVNLGISGYRFSQGDVVGGSLSLASAIPILGWAAVGIDVAREFGAFEGTPLGLKKEKPKNKIDERLKAQETKQRETASSSDVTFASITDKFDKVVSKFEKFANGMGAAISGKQPSKAGNGEYKPSDQPLAPNDPTEPPPPPLPPGSFAKAPEEVLSDAASFRQAFPLAKATPKLSIEPYELQMRENDSLGSLGNDPQVDPVHVTGSAHYENRAIDIPVNNMDLGDKVANWWRGKGYKVLWRVAGHYNHVHVQWAKGQKKDKPNSPQNNKVNTVTKQQSIEDFVKGTKSGDRILNDPKLKAQLTGEKYQFKNTMIKTPVTDPEVKQALQMYNAYVLDIRSRRQDQVKAQTGDQIPAQILTPPPIAAQQAAIFLMGDQSQQVASQPQVIPVAVPTGNGGGGVTVIMPSEGQILNSLWTTMLLTNLSSA